MFVLSITSIIIQFFNGSVLVEMFASSIALLFITFTIERTSIVADDLTGCKKKRRFYEDVKKSFLVSKEEYIIVVSISNYETLSTLFSYKQFQDLNRTIASLLISKIKKYKIWFDDYYLENGIFAFVIEERYKAHVKNIKDELYNYINSNIDLNNLSCNVEAKTVLINIPNDFNNIDTLITFILNYHKNDKTLNNAIISDEYSKEEIEIKNNINKILNDAIINNSFIIYYQPIYSTKENKFISCEALLRLKYKNSFISPQMFIPIAEKNGLIYKIGDFVFEKVCEFVASPIFKTLGLEYIEVNLSIVQLMQPALAKNYINIMKKYNINASKINLELTETATTVNQDVIKNNIKDFLDYGIKFSLDDYGTGYSNLTRISALPLSIVKIDKSFVDNYNKESVSKILNGTIEMLKNLNLQIVVEGVEHEDCAKFFINLNCDYVQGYYYSKPLPLSDFINFLEKK